MSDIRITWATTRGDWSVKGAQLQDGNDLATAVTISLFTDRVAAVDDVPPDGTGDPRGWWADDTQRPIGSRLWLIERAKRTNETLARAESYINEALQWLIDDGVVAAFDVTVEWHAQNTLGARVVARKMAGGVEAMNFEWAWNLQPDPLVVSASLTAPSADDPYWSNVLLLLKGEGANGATTFTDSSSFARSISRNGTTAITTAQAKFGAASINLPGSSNLSCGTGIGFSGAFTIEAWVRYTNESLIGQVIFSSQGTSPYFYISKGTNSTNSRIEARVNATVLSGAPYDLVANTWYFVQFTRSAGGALSLYVNGVLKDSGSNSSSIPTGRAILVGGDSVAGNAFVGQIDELRITDGVVRPTTVPTDEFPTR